MTLPLQVTRQYWLNCGQGWSHSLNRPPTELQASIAGLLAFVRDREASARDFIAAIDRVMQKARSLEDQRDAAVKEREEIEAGLALVPPKFSVRVESWADRPRSLTAYTISVRIDDLPEWRVMLSDQERALLRQGAPNKAARVMRWRTYLGFSREIRKRLNEAFDKIYGSRDAA